MNQEPTLKDVMNQQQIMAGQMQNLTDQQQTMAGQMQNLTDQQQTMVDQMQNLTDQQQTMMETVQDFAANVDRQFVDVRERLTRTESSLAMKADKADLLNKVDKVDLQKLVTKDYLDDKMANQTSEIVGRMRKEDERVLETVKEWMGRK